VCGGGGGVMIPRGTTATMTLRKESTHCSNGFLKGYI